MSEPPTKSAAAKKLKAQHRLSDQQLETVIERAMALQRQREAEAAQTSLEEAKSIGVELEIAPDLMEQAFAEMAQSKPDTPKTRSALLLLLFIGVALVPVFIFWLSSPAPVAPTKPTIAPTKVKPMQAENKAPPTEIKTQKPKTEIVAKKDMAGSMDLAGTWRLVAHRAFKGAQLIEGESSKSFQDPELEQWQFNEGQVFTHRMGKSLSFSGSYQIDAISPAIRLPNTAGNYFVLHTTDVVSPILPTGRPHEYFIGVMQEDALILHYLGQKLELGERLPQGARFKRPIYKQ